MTKSKLTDKQELQIINLYESGLSCYKILDLLKNELGVKTIKSIHSCLKRNGIKLRPKHSYEKAMKGKNMYYFWEKRYGKEIAEKKMDDYKEKRRILHSGENNPMYGVPPKNGSGCGYKGWYKTHYFRSLREVAYMIHLDENNIPWSSAEKKSFEIKYINWDGADRTYRPDFLINEKNLIEIKPKRLHKSPTIMAKTKAALVWAAANGFTYEIIDFEIDATKIMTALNEGLIKFNRDYKERFLKYIKSTCP